MTNNAIFHNGLSAATINCTLVVDKDSLLIYLDTPDKELIIWNIKSIVTCQYTGTMLSASYGSHPSQSIECSGNIAKSIYHVYSNQNVVATVEKFVFSNGLKAAIVLTVLFFVLGIFSYFVLIPYVGEKSASLIPIDTEIKLGSSIADRIKESTEQNDSVNLLMDDFLKRLKFSGPYQIKAHVITSNNINAFALPGGNIFVYSQIISKMKNYKELVALLGHEQSHVLKQHSLKSICRSASTSIFISTLFGDITGISTGILSQAQQFEQLNYSRELETEADDEGIKFMITNKTNPQGMVNLLELLKTEAEQMPNFMKYLSTHPETESRITNVKSQLNVSQNFETNLELETIFEKMKNKVERAVKE